MLKSILTGCSFRYASTSFSLWIQAYKEPKLESTQASKTQSRSQSPPQTPLIGQFGNIKIKILKFHEKIKKQ